MTHRMGPRLQVFPRSSSETPALLADLERTIAAATHTAADAAAAHRRRPESTAPQASAALAAHGAAANLAIHVHSAALDRFIEGFPTYARLLTEMKGEFERALNRAIECARDNVELRQQRSADKAARAQAVDQAYQKVHRSALVHQPACHGDLSVQRAATCGAKRALRALCSLFARFCSVAAKYCWEVQAAAVAGDFRQSAHKKLIALEEREVAAQRRSAAAQERIACISGDLEAARADVARLLAVNLRLKALCKAEEEWSKKGRHAVLRSVTLGPVTLEVRFVCWHGCFRRRAPLTGKASMQMEHALEADAVPAAVMRKSVLKVSNTLKLSPRNHEPDPEPDPPAALMLGVPPASE
jgi:hypothetical protein